ncbi:MAG: caspase family protein [Bacteroidota bacterium]
MKKLALLWMFCWPLWGIAQSDAPILTLDMEMHTAIVKKVDADVTGRYILTCSRDKVAKLWDAKSGKLLKKYRPPIGKGDKGRQYSAAISPNGKYVVIGARSISNSTNKATSIYIFETQTGILLQKLNDFSSTINDLEFSEDGQYLAVALGGGRGIHVYTTDSWTIKKIDSDYGERSLNVAFGADGKLASVCFDGYIRLYDEEFNLLIKKKATGGKSPYSIAFSADSKLLAIGYYDSPILQVLDGKTLKVMYEPQNTLANTLNQRLSMVTFSRDGQKLIAGGMYGKKEAKGKRWNLIRVWDNQGKGSFIDYAVTRTTFSDLKILENENILFAGYTSWGIYDGNLEKKIVDKSAKLNNYRKTDRSHFKINKDGSEISVTPVYQKPLMFNVNTRQLTEEKAVYSGFRDISGELKITNWKNSSKPKINKADLSFLKKYEICYSVDIANHEKSIVFGTGWALCALNTEGNRQWRTTTLGINWAVNIAANNKVVAACQGNGIIRWYRMTDGELLLTLFLHPDRKRWVLWTPSGYYDASAGAEEFIGWHVNQGPDAEALYYPISKFRSTYYRPDVIDRILQTTDEARALELANRAAGRSTGRTRSIVEKLPPIVRILSPTLGAEVQANRIDVEYSIKSPNDEPVTAVKILVDGRPVEHERGLKPSGKRQTVSIRIPSRNCTVSVIAENRFGASPPANVDLTWQGQLELSIKPNLYILSVGVADYDDDQYDLDYADDDARAFTRVFQKQEGVLYNQVVAKTFTDKQATKDNILDGLEWLTNETTQRDVAMIFFAGHGIQDNRGTFYYLPVNANDKYKKRTCLMEADIQETVSVVTGKIIVFMDACHSGSLMLASSTRRGNPDISRIVNELIDAENGAVVFSSSTGRQSSLEDARWGHGAFTKALVEGLEGRAKDPKDQKITCKSLDLYITNRVKQLTGGEMTPTTNYPPNVPDFPIAIIKE